MRYTKTLIPTLKEDPADAEVVSHKLMVRAGMIRQVARGIYDFLPLGWRVVRKVEQIVREEMDRAGAQEILMPAVCPAELWEESGRWDKYGRELLRIRDRQDRDFCFGPTHEEVVTDLVRRDVRSYRELPLNLYQIQTKFRDEVRPRFGLMRGREFLMKDAYSFHATAEDCHREYQLMADTYRRIFQRCGLETRQVESDTGAIGGRRAHEFQVLADSGEDAIVSCNVCEYAANVEKAEIGPSSTASASLAISETKKIVRTPDKRSVDDVAAFLSEPVERFIKTLLWTTDSGEVIAALVRGDHELSDVKLGNVLGVAGLQLADPATVERVTGAEVGFAGPFEFKDSVRVVADAAIRRMTGAVAGANQTDHHIVGIDQERDLGSLEFVDIRQARAGDPCPRCAEGVFTSHRGIEVGNIFFLGTKYSSAMKATFLDADGQEKPMEMGCYGIGVSRTAAAAVEQYHDANGIVWPMALAPFQVQVVPVKWSDDRMRGAAEELYGRLQRAGVETLLDDRDERPGVKFKDADLIGTPLRVTVGGKGLDRGCFELKRRDQAESSDLPLETAVDQLRSMVDAALER